MGLNPYTPIVAGNRAHTIHVPAPLPVRPVSIPGMQPQRTPEPCLPPIDLIPEVANPFSRTAEERTPRDVGLSRDMIDLVTSAEMIAMGEIADLSRYITDFKYPEVPKLPRRFRSTASTMWQHLRRGIGRFAETRRIEDTDRFMVPAAIGPLPFAAVRALRRSRTRALKGATPILEIGAGQRLVAAGLKALHGDAIELHEASPRYADVRGVIDFEHAARNIDDAILPPSYFELIYSIYGSYYSRNQLDVLHKAVNSLRIGGELFLMWKANRRNRTLALLAQLEAAFFQRNGLDLSIEQHSDGSLLHPENVITVWARKRTPSVDVRGLFRGADALRDVPPTIDRQPTARLSAEGPYFPMKFLAPPQLAFLSGMMVDTACETLGMPIADLARTIAGSKSEFSDETDARNRIVGQIMGEYLTPLAHGVPLSTAVMKLLYRAIPLAITGMTIPGQERRDILVASAMMRG